jgi:hypothetical protein
MNCGRYTAFSEGLSLEPAPTMPPSNVCKGSRVRVKLPSMHSRQADPRVAHDARNASVSAASLCRRLIEPASNPGEGHGQSSDAYRDGRGGPEGSRLRP